MIKKVLVTGANGFIGASLKKLFSNKGYITYGIDRTETDGVIKIDLIDEDELKKFIAQMRPDIIIHCAGSANVSLSVTDPGLDFKLNVILTHNLLTAIHCIKDYHPRLVFLSSAGVYGNPIALPITEDMPYNPLSPYALHKIMCEEACIFYMHNYDLDVKIARIFSAYGSGLRKQIFWDMYQKYKGTNQLNMYGTGDESRDYIEINDLGNVLYLLAEADTDQVIFNVANGEEMTIRYVTETFASIVGLPLSAISFNRVVREGDPINWCADIGRIKSLGYTKQVSMETGLKTFVDWAKAIE